MNEHDGGRDTINEKLVDQLLVWATDHADRSNGKIEVLPIGHSRFPKKLEHHIAGNPKSHETTDLIASLANDSYSDMKMAVQLAERGQQEISRIGELLKAGNNVAVITPHADTADVALVQAAIYGELDRLDYRFRSGIVISQMISLLSYKIDDARVPALDALSDLEDDIFLSYPRTVSASKHMTNSDSFIQRKAIASRMTAHNALMRRGVARSLQRGGLLLAVAPSGTTDWQDPDDPNLYHLSHVNRTTRSMLQESNTFVLPMAVSYGEDTETIFEFAALPQTLQSPDDLHDAMHLIAETLTEQSTSRTVVYDQQP